MRYISSPSRIKTATRARSYYYDEYGGTVTADQVIDTFPEEGIDTGLVNEEGWPIYRLREPVGFVPQD